MSIHSRAYSFFFFNDTATTEIYTLSLHDALPISAVLGAGPDPDRLLRPRQPGDAPLYDDRASGRRPARESRSVWARRRRAADRRHLLARYARTHRAGDDAVRGGLAARRRRPRRARAARHA